MDDNNKPWSFNLFKGIADLYALVFCSLIPAAVTIPFMGYAHGLPLSLCCGAVLLIGAMQDEEFLRGYEDGISEEYDEYISSITNN